MKIDIFCKVVDFYGDVAVSYRLAKALVFMNNSLEVRFFCTDIHIIKHLYPHYLQDDIKTYYYNHARYVEEADVAIEAFSCDLPNQYKKPQLIVNLEYLTAETWIQDYHLLESVGMNKSGKKFFFFPSFTKEGSLIHGDFLLNVQKIKDNYLVYKNKLIKELYISKHFIQRPWLLVYLYEISEYTLTHLSQHFAIIVITKNTATQKSSAWITQKICSQEQFDILLCISDRSLIRGEDSLSRAVLAGKPFLWQAYRQEENYHLVKVKALSHLLLKINPEFSHAWFDLQRELNECAEFNFKKFMELPYSSFSKLAQEIQSYPSLEQNLYAFIKKHL